MSLTKKNGTVPTKSKKFKSEDEVILECKKWLRLNGWTPVTMFTGGIPIGGGFYATNPAKGIPDSVNFHIEQEKFLWIEYKKEKGGILSPEQEMWHHKLKKCKQIVLVVHSLKSLQDQLKELYESK